MKLRYVLIGLCIGLSFLPASAMMTVLDNEEALPEALSPESLADICIESELLEKAPKLYSSDLEDSSDSLRLTLLLYDAILQLSSKKGYTRLHVAAQKGDSSVIEYLIQKGASANAQGANGITPLHIVALKGGMFCMYELLKAKDIKMLEDTYGRLPSHLAALNGHSSILFDLQHLGEVNAKAAGGITAFHAAASRGQVEFINHAIHESTAWLTGEHWKAGMYCLTDDGISVIDYARIYGHERLVRYFEMLELVKDLPLHLAVLTGNGYSVKKANIPVDSKLAGGITLLHIAAFGKDKDFNVKEIINHLVRKGVDVFALTDEGASPADYAKMQGHDGLALYLDMLKTLNDYPLHRAALRGNVDQSLTNVNQRVPGGITPLHAAALGGSKKVVQRLLRLGADIFARSDKDMSAVEYADSQGNNVVANFLEDQAKKTISQNKRAEKMSSKPKEIVVC